MSDSRPPLFGWLLLAALLAGAVVSWPGNRPELDDAYISYRYAANLAAGEGLVFNPGEPVEGYSNFLWVVLLAAGDLVGLDSPWLGPRMGIAALLALLAVGWAAIWTPWFRMGLRGVDRVTATAGLALLVIPHGMVEMAGAGLETALFALLVAAGGLAVARADLQTTPSLLRLGLVPVLLYLTRPDGVIPGVALLLVVAIRAGRERASAALGLWAAVIAATPALAVGAAYAVFKLATFGSLVPNPYYAKGADAVHAAAGIAYLGGVAATYPFAVAAPVIVLAVLLFGRPSEAVRRLGLYALATTLLYALFVVKAGGDFMEYRLALHILPLGSLAAVLAVCALPGRRWLKIVTVAGLIGLCFRPVTLETRYYMQDLEEMHAYVETGRRVGAALGRLPAGTRVATTLIGTVGYDSGLPIVDQWGLVDPEVRQRPPRDRFYRGHVRFADREISRRLGAQLYLDHPHLCRCDPLCLRDSRQVLIAAGDGACVRAEVLIPDPALTEALCNDPSLAPFAGVGVCRP